MDNSNCSNDQQYNSNSDTAVSHHQTQHKQHSNNTNTASVATIAFASGASCTTTAAALMAPPGEDNRNYRGIAAPALHVPLSVSQVLQRNILNSGDVTIDDPDNSTLPSTGPGDAANTHRSKGGHMADHSSHNIPYMQLFHHLKQKFPDLKDCDINESIQKFGLERSECEAELQQKVQAGGHMTGYYGPWRRNLNNWPANNSRSSPATPTRATPTRSTELVSEQRERQQRLLSVLREGETECQGLQTEVSSLGVSLTRSRSAGDHAAAASAQRIEDMQEHNRRLQSEVDQLEGEILQSGEGPEVLEQLTGAPASPHYPTRPNGGSDLPSPGGRRLTPTRTAPPPPSPRHPRSASYSSHHEDERIAANASNSSPTTPTNAGVAPSNTSGLPLARWSCSRCTYDNHPAMDLCEICGAIRLPGANILPPYQQPNQYYTSSRNASNVYQDNVQQHPPTSYHQQNSGINTAAAGSNAPLASGRQQHNLHYHQHHGSSHHTSGAGGGIGGLPGPPPPSAGPPHASGGAPGSSSASSLGSPIQDIHIQVRHRHDYPKLPPDLSSSVFPL